MTAVLVTGMSGTGKSSVLVELARRGHDVVDTDSDEWSEWVTDAAGRPDWIWRADHIGELLSARRRGTLYIAGCKSNQGQFYDRFDAVVLLSAPESVLKERIASRDTNHYGSAPGEWDEIIANLAVVEPLLRATATNELDATRPLSELADELETLGQTRIAR